jgi:quercetin dioxygenase-like cupin family protein
MTIRVVVVAACMTMVLSTGLSAQGQAIFAPATKSKLVNFPGLPTCMKGSVQNGDPSKGSSVILGKGLAGCRIPWHWHTATEQLMMVAGNAKVEMKDGAPMVLHPGDYASLPTKHVHQFTCQTACTLFIASDAAFDIHYVDSSGQEIPADQALKSQTHTAGSTPEKK